MALQPRELVEGRVQNYLMAVLRRLYVLRKQLFHGCATFESKANRDTLEPAVAVLSILVPIFYGAVELRGEVSVDLGEPPFKPDRRWASRQADRPEDRAQPHAGPAGTLNWPDRSNGPDRDAPTTINQPSGPDADSWLELCWRVEQCYDCVAMAPHAVTRPLKRGEVPHPPASTRMLFVGVAPTAQKGLNGGAHFYSSPTDALRKGLFRVLDRLLESHLVEANDRGLSEGTRRFIDLGYFFLHAAKVRPFYDDAPPPVVLKRCALAHLGPELCFLAPLAVCFLGKNNLGIVARQLFGTELSATPERTSIGSWHGWAAIAPQPIRGWDNETERIIRDLDAAVGD